jgi:hypothetical protein
MNNLEKEFIPYEQALELEKLGFDEPCFGVYATKDGYVRKSAYDEIGNAPLYQQAFRWFREKYGLWQIVLQNTDIDWTYDILPINGIHDYSLIDVFETYEEAELECLKKLITLIKNK